MRPYRKKHVIIDNRLFNKFHFQNDVVHILQATVELYQIRMLRIIITSRSSLNALLNDKKTEERANLTLAVQ